MLQRALGRSDAHRRIAAAFVVEVCEQRLERRVVVGVSGDEHVVGLDEHVVEGDLGLGGRVHSHAAVHAGDRHTGPVHLDHDRPDSLRPCAAGPTAPHEHAVGHMSEGGVVLVAVEPPAPAASHLGEGASHLLYGRASVGFGDADRKKSFAVGHRRQPTSLEGVVAEVLDASRWSVVGELAPDRGGHVGSGDLFQHDRRLDVAVAEPTPFLANGHSEQVGGREGLGCFAGRLAGLVAVGGPGSDLAKGELTGELPQGGLVV